MPPFWWKAFGLLKPSEGATHCTFNHDIIPDTKIAYQVVQIFKLHYLQIATLYFLSEDSGDHA